MTRAGNPWDIPEWHSVRREAVLVRHLIGSGTTALGRANYADQIGEYYTAFFGLSVGLERLAKLILVVDHAISNSGSMPDQKIVRQFGHKLADLVDEAGKNCGEAQPNTSISSAYSPRKRENYGVS